MLSISTGISEQDGCHCFTPHLSNGGSGHCIKVIHHILPDTAVTVHHIRLKNISACLLGSAQSQTGLVIDAIER